MATDNDNLKAEKKIQYYAAICNAWFASKLQRDKSLLTLSAGAIGLLVTLLTTVGAFSKLQIHLYALAILCFIICLISTISIFQRNADYLDKLVNEEKSSDPVIKCLDKTAYGSFILGIIISFMIGISSGIAIYNKQEDSMNDKKVENITRQPGDKISKHSYDGAGNLDPDKQPTEQENQEGSSDSNEGDSGEDK